MEWMICKYHGFIKEEYVFSDKKGDNIKFNKCRKDLIEMFQLNNENSINQWFKINFFKTKSTAPIHVENTVLIISNMEILKE